MLLLLFRSTLFSSLFGLDIGANHNWLHDGAAAWKVGNVEHGLLIGVLRSDIGGAVTGVTYSVGVVLE